MGKLITIVESARRLGLSEQTMRNWIKDGHIPFKNVGKSRYIDEDAIDALGTTIDDIERSKRILSRIKGEIHDDIRTCCEQRYEDTTRTRYMNLMVGAALRSRFYDTMVRLMCSYGSLNEREGAVLTRYLKGETMDSIKDSFGCTRERIRQIVEKAIRKSGDITGIESALDKMKELNEKVSILEAANKRLSERLATYEQEEPENSVEISDELCKLLSTRIRDCELSVRAKNCLTAGYVERKFSFGKIEPRVIVSPCDTIGDLCQMKRIDFLKIRNAGHKTLKEIDDFLAENGLCWDMNITSLKP